jgi:hypothetical protein
MTEFGQRLISPPPRLRLAAAVLVVGAALTGAAILHGHRVLHFYPCTSIHCLISARLERPGWVDPLALAISLLGLAIAAAILVQPLRRFVIAGVVLAVAVGGAVALSGHRVVGAEYACPATAGYPCFHHPRPAWVLPTMGGLVLLGLAGAAVALVAIRRSLS